MTIESVDQYLGLMPRGEEYNCLHFTREVWLAHTGDDIGERLRIFADDGGQSKLQRSDVLAFKKLNEPVDPCLVVMRSTQRRPHVGVYLRGRILHLRDDGSAFDPVDVVRLLYDKLAFYI